MTKKLGWGILSTGRIAGIFAQGLARAENSRLVAVGSRTVESAQKFAAAHGHPRAYGSYEELLADAEVEAVYIAVPHPQHVEWAVKAAEAGKHILCEKPIGLNYAEAMVMAEAARANKVLLMEAFMYRCHPQTAKIVELVRSGAIGEVKLVQATFGFNAGFNAESRLWSNAAGGGGILDVGCYAVSFSRLIAGAMSGKPFLNPTSVTGAGELHPQTGVDVVAAATLKFANGLVAQVATSVGLSQDNSARIYGSTGWIEVPSPWIPPSEGTPAKFFLHKDGKKEEMVVATAQNLYGLEADAVATALERGEREVSAMSIADTLGNMAALDAWRAAIGLTYEAEKPENFHHTHARRPLAKRPDAAIPTGTIPHLAKPVSRLIMGCDNTTTMPHSAAMWDDYFARGGHTFDTAYVYWSGLQERLLGQWVKNRGLREDISIIVKGAHTPFCTPEYLTEQLHESLGRLQTNYADIYMLHRDNLEVPIGEFVEVLNEHVKAGRIKAFGGSNWTLARVAAANRYAARKGLQGFSVVSNNFSLARMVEAPWAGCISASDKESRRWLKKHQIPLLAWSSQARGFFTDRAAPDKREDEQLVRCWYSEDNFERQARAIALAKKKATTPIAIAAAYVLAQPFPTFALIGPRIVSETVSSLECLKLSLTPKEIAWLNLERERP